MVNVRKREREMGKGVREEEKESKRETLSKRYHHYMNFCHVLLVLLHPDLIGGRGPRVFYWRCYFYTGSQSWLTHHSVHQAKQQGK